MNKKLAKITKASLNIMDRGLLTFWIYVDYEDGLSQGVGGMCLDTRDKREGFTRIGTAYGCEMIRRLLLELKVDDFSEMKGKHVWVLGEGDNFSFKTSGIQSLNVDNKDSKPVIFSDIFKQFEKEVK